MHREEVNQMKLEDSACPLCGHGDADHVLAGQDLINRLPGKFNVVKCQVCDLMRTNPRPSRTDIGVYYPDSYGPYKDTKIRSSDHLNSRYASVLRSLKGLLFETRANAIPKCKPGKLLEIGCASGSFLHAMANSGWKVSGIEFSDKAAAAVTRMGYEVFAGSVESAPAPESPYDLIAGWMVFEHLHDPVADLKKLRTWSSSNTWLVLSVPNAASLQFGFFSESWHDLHLPNHLFHFTPQTIDKVLSAGGWKIHSIHHQRTIGNLLTSAGNLLNRKGYTRLGKQLTQLHRQMGKSRHVLYPLAWLLSLFGQTGRMTVWATVDESHVE